MGIVKWYIDCNKNMTNQENKEVLQSEEIIIQIPQCCREGLASCPHVPKRDKPKKQNVGL